MGVVTGQHCGRVVGIALVCSSLVAAFLSMSHHPAGLVLALALGVGVTWARCIFDEEASAGCAVAGPPDRGCADG
jgi:hypothetical protein